MEKKIILKISGGIGNQLFQFSYAYNMAKEKKIKLIINTYYQNFFWKLGRNFPLSSERKFKLSEMRMIPKDILVVNCKENILIDFLIRFKLTRFLLVRYLIELMFSKIYLDGYFQGPKDFNKTVNIISELKARYILTRKTNDINSKNCVIHVRAGDLINHPWNRKHCGRKYYNKAIDLMINKYGILKFYVVSENVEYAKKILKDKLKYITFLESSDDISDFNTLASFRYLIASNSTYSWWAAVLGNPTSFVAPKFFYSIGDKPSRIKNELQV